MRPSWIIAITLLSLGGLYGRSRSPLEKPDKEADEVVYLGDTPLNRKWTIKVHQRVRVEFLETAADSTWIRQLVVPIEMSMTQMNFIQILDSGW